MVSKQMKSNSQKDIPDLDKALEEFTHFVKSLLPLEPLSEGFIPEIIFSSSEDGAVLLTGIEAQNYRECLRKLVEVATSREQISPKAVESLYQKAILEILDINGRRSNQSIEQRLVKATQNLKTALNAKPCTFRVYYPVNGLAADGLPVKVGNVTFCIFGDEHLGEFEQILDHQEVSEQERQIKAKIIDDWMDDWMKDIIEKPIGITDVSAIEADAARSLALKELRLTLDIINFYSDMLPSKGHLFIIGEAERTAMTIPVLLQSNRPAVNLQMKVTGPLSPLSLRELSDLDARKTLGFATISNILSKEQRSKLEDRLVAAMQWAGRATVDNRREEAFLLYMIALESIMLAENDRDELGYRLRVRVAHLLGRDLQARRRLSEQVRDLYRIRSQIIHSGKYEVKYADLGLIRSITKKCILRILVDEPFKSMNNPNDLVSWFDEQILRT